jgi:CBS domain-containing protein
MLSSISVKDYMTAKPVTFTTDMDVLDAIHLLIEREISGAPVVDKLGNVVGMLSERDCLKVALNASYYAEKGGKVSEFMSQDVKTVDINASLVDIAQMFLSAPFKRYPVMRDGELVGQISRSDILKALQVLR